MACYRVSRGGFTFGIFSRGLCWIGNLARSPSNRKEPGYMEQGATRSGCRGLRLGRDGINCGTFRILARFLDRHPHFLRAVRIRHRGSRRNNGWATDSQRDSQHKWRVRLRCQSKSLGIVTDAQFMRGLNRSSRMLQPARPFPSSSIVAGSGTAGPLGVPSSTMLSKRTFPDALVAPFKTTETGLLRTLLPCWISGISPPC